MPHPLVVHCKKDAYDVYVGRPSRWGNPFVVGQDGTREQVIAKYERWLKGNRKLMSHLSMLQGKKLGCYCAPLPCHADVLARLANPESSIPLL